jgi:hypothetical protein
VSGAAIKNAVEIGTSFREGEKIPETVKKRAQQRLRKADEDEPR